MEEMNNIVTDVVAEEGTAYDTDTEASTTSEIEETTEVVDTQTEDNSPKGEKNNRYADFRRKEELRMANEQLGSLKSEKESLANRIAAYEEKERRLNQLLGNYYDGDDLDAKMLSIEAQIRGVTIDDLRAEQQQVQAQQQEKQRQLDELAYYKSIAEQVQREKAQKMYDEDLAAVKALDPNVNSLEELGDEFKRLRFTENPLTGELYSVADVYNHIKSKIKPLPQTSGTVNTTAEEVKETDFMSISNAEFEKYYNKVVYGG